eukprot:scaffold26050_cov53-Phaeocystis_antarctica.AAC.6
MGAGRTQRSPILLAYTSSPSSRLGRALVESCTGSAWAFDIVFRMDGVPEASNQRSCVRPKEVDRFEPVQAAHFKGAPENLQPGAPLHARGVNNIANVATRRRVTPRPLCSARPPPARTYVSSITSSIASLVSNSSIASSTSEYI